MEGTLVATRRAATETMVTDSEWLKLKPMYAAQTDEKRLPRLAAKGTEAFLIASAVCMFEGEKSSIPGGALGSR